jgi:hypothetical protein
MAQQAEPVNEVTHILNDIRIHTFEVESDRPNDTNHEFPHPIDIKIATDIYHFLFENGMARRIVDFLSRGQQSRIIDFVEIFEKLMKKLKETMIFINGDQSCGNLPDDGATVLYIISRYMDLVDLVVQELMEHQELIGWNMPDGVDLGSIIVWECSQMLNHETDNGEDEYKVDYGVNGISEKRFLDMDRYCGSIYFTIIENSNKSYHTSKNDVRDFHYCLKEYLSNEMVYQLAFNIVAHNHCFSDSTYTVETDTREQSLYDLVSVLPTITISTPYTVDGVIRQNKNMFEIGCKLLYDNSICYTVKVIALPGDEQMQEEWKTQEKKEGWMKFLQDTIVFESWIDLERHFYFPGGN